MPRLAALQDGLAEVLVELSLGLEVVYRVECLLHQAQLMRVVVHPVPHPLGGQNKSVESYLCHTDTLQGGLDPSKKSGVGVDFELLVRCLLLENKVEARKPSMIFR